MISSLLGLSMASLFSYSKLKCMVPFLMLSLLFCVPCMNSIYSSKMFYHFYWSSLDGLSTFLVILTMWMTILMCLAMSKSKNLKKLFLSFLSLNLILMLSFMSKSMFGFFIFFELSLMPTLYMILGWGIQPERIQAGSYLMIYTVVGALPLLGCLLYLEYHGGILKIFMPSLKKCLFFSINDYSLYVMFWILAFLVKLPMYGVHLWLPKAHVEAPVGGSMVLAGILLKLGAYGLCRSLRLLNLDMCFWSNVLFMWSMVSMCLVGILCFRQCDLKSLVAYSSVAHMSLMLAACFSCDLMGYKGMMAILVSHGLCSSGLFFGVQCMYENSGTRKLYMNRGWISMSPAFCFFWFLLCVGNASAPPSLNLLGEFFLFSSMISFGSFMAGFFSGLSVFLGGLFSMYLYVCVSHGKVKTMKKFYLSLTPRNMLMLFLHVTPLYGLIFLSNYIFVFG